MSVIKNKAVAQDFAQIVAAVNACGGVIRDDHGAGRTLKVSGIGNLQRGDRKFAVPFCDSKYFCLNALYIGENGEARVSRDSIGGTVELFGAPLADGILGYNASQSTNLFTASFITDVHYLVDGKLEAVDLVTAEDVAKLQAMSNEARDAWEASRKQA